MSIEQAEDGILRWMYLSRCRRLVRFAELGAPQNVLMEEARLVKEARDELRRRGDVSDNGSTGKEEA